MHNEQMRENVPEIIKEVLVTKLSISTLTSDAPKEKALIHPSSHTTLGNPFKASLGNLMQFMLREQPYI